MMIILLLKIHVFWLCTSSLSSNKFVHICLFSPQFPPCLSPQKVDKVSYIPKKEEEKKARKKQQLHVFST